MSTQNDFQRLRELAVSMRPIDEAGDIEEFEALLSKYVGHTDPKTLSELLTVFDDRCEFPEVMYGLVHLVETWPLEIYITTLLSKLDKLYAGSPGWLRTLLYGILNQPEAYNSLKYHINQHGKEILELLIASTEKEFLDH